MKHDQTGGRTDRSRTRTCPNCGNDQYECRSYGCDEREPEGPAGFDPKDVARINRRTDHLMGRLSWQESLGMRVRLAGIKVEALTGERIA